VGSQISDCCQRIQNKSAPLFLSTPASAAMSLQVLPSGRPELIQQLRSSLQQAHRSLRLNNHQHDVVSTGIPALDHLLPQQGLPRGTLSEWIAAEPGSGMLFLAMQVAGQAQRSGPLVIIDALQCFYPPAFTATGVQTDHTILIRPKSRADELWAMEQCLRCRGTGAVLCQIDSLKTKEFRRLQLAAESGNAIGLLIRSAAARRQPGWADVRLLIAPQTSPLKFHRRVEVRCLYAKGSLNDQIISLDICDETGAVRLAAGVSHSATASRTG